MFTQLLVPVIRTFRSARRLTATSKHLLLSIGLGLALGSAELAAKPLAVKGPDGNLFTLYGIDSIDAGECSGVAQAEIDRLLIAGGIEMKPESPVLGGGGYVFVRGRLLNALVLGTGCAKLTASRGTYIPEMRNAEQSAVLAQKGAHKPRTATKEELAALDKEVEQWQNRVQPAGYNWAGTGSKDTESFSVASREWTVNWSATPTSSVGGLLAVTVHRASDGQMVGNLSSGRIGQATADRSFVRAAPGRYYLSIHSANVQWRVSIAEQ
jgi:hypothetical protein